ncbi:hypothetical protein [Methylobacter luteus]|nr:hypothetical protein [Methylobacter luteus]
MKIGSNPDFLLRNIRFDELQLEKVSEWEVAGKHKAIHKSFKNDIAL